jgi:maleate isomerase
VSQRRIGLIVPSSNTTMERELPAMLQQHAAQQRWSFHSSRAVMHSVDSESLDRMVEQTERCAHELCDADVDAIVYACLVALMVRGPAAHEDAERQLRETATERLGRELTVTSSAGALVRALQALGAERVAIVTPYVPELTEQVRAYLEHAGVEVVDSLSLGVPDNLAVGRLDPARLPGHIAAMDLSGADVLVASACVQMPSLPVVSRLEEEFGLPVLTAATATAWDLITGLGLPADVPNAGLLLRAEAASAHPPD